MSLNRLIFYSAMIGGWAAFVGWLLSELFLLRRSTDAGVLVVFITTALVGAFIAGGLTLLGGVASGTLRGQWPRLFPGLLGGFVAGAIGGLIGNLIFGAFEALIGETAVWRSFIGPVVRMIGWTIMGLAIGAVEGIYDRSPKKVRNGLIGGGIGGLLGGLLFEPVNGWVGGVMSSRAASFVILGTCVGFFIGLAQVVLKEAWLTVETGFRPGRQLVLNVPEIILGTSEKAALPFIAYGAKGVEPVHVRIVRRDDGAYLLQDNHSRTGTFLNGQQVQDVAVLRDNDVFQLGTNKVRFREGRRSPARSERQAPSAEPMKNAGAMAIPVAMPAAPVAAIQPTAGRPPASATPVAASVQQAVRATPAAPAVASKPAPQPGVTPAATVAGSAGTAPTCPVCGRKGVAIPNTTRHRCASCGINF